ncbi:MAG: hypothetical protein ACQERC_08325 [Bacteroidota bacterium]
MKNLLSNFNLKDKHSGSFKNEQLLVIIFLIIYLVFSWIYGFSTNATWDDCPNRYYNCLNAFNDPKHFVSVWNRPLFTVIFAFLVPLGK